MRRLLCDVDLVEDAAVCKVLGLRFLPTADRGDVDKFQRREAGHILGRGLRRIPAAIVVGEDDRLRFRGVEEVQIGFGQLTLIFGKATGGSARTETDGTTMSN